MEKQRSAILEYFDICIVFNESMSAWAEVAENKRLRNHTRVCVCISLQKTLSSWLYCILIHVQCIFYYFLL